MQKERLGSFVHMLGFTWLVAMTYVTVISMLAGLTVAVLNPVITNVLEGSFLWDSGFLDMMLCDLLDAKPFSLVFTTVFAVDSLLKMRESFYQRLGGRKSNLCMAILYITLSCIYFTLNKTVFVSKTTIFAIALLVVILVEFSKNEKNGIMLWSTMEKIPKYYTTNLFSIVTLVIATVGMFVLIKLSTFAITKFLCFICDVLSFPFMFKFIITKLLDSLKYILMLVTWADMGSIHDGIIASYYEKNGTRF